jgi:hypothetical protein
VSGLASLLLAAAVGGVASAQSASPGFTADEVSIAPAGAFVGGFEVLANGNYAVFDGTSVVELSSVDGSFVQTIFKPHSVVFGSFLTLSPDGATLYFGEGTEGHVWEIDLASGSASWSISAVYPYDLAFDPQGRAFLSYATSLFGGSHVALCDFAAGTLDDVVDLDEPSGPLVFDAAGNLYTAATDVSIYPPPPGSTALLEFAAADLASGVGPGTIGEDVATQLASLDGGSGIALDEQGDVLVTDPNSGSLYEVDGRTLDVTVDASAGLYTSFLYLREQRGTKGNLEPWQPSDAGTVLAVRTDFFSFNGLTRVRPARPVCSTSPASPVPVGTFQFDVTGAVPDGFGLMLVTGGAADDETPLSTRGWPAPLFLGVDFTTGLTVYPVFFDSLGELHEQVDNPGLGDATVAFQLVAAASGAGPYYGTSETIEVDFQ